MLEIYDSVINSLEDHKEALQSGCYGVQNFTIGDMPEYGFIRSVHMDVEGGLCTDIRIYTVGEAMEPIDYYGKSVDITEAIESLIIGEIDWDGLIETLCELIENEG